MRMVRPSWVMITGILRAVRRLVTTRHSLNLASSSVMRFRTKRPLVSYNMRKLSPDLGSGRESMKPAGKWAEVRTLPSTFTSLRRQISSHSFLVRAYLRRLRRMTISGTHSRSLWGPEVGRGAQMPPNLSSVQWLGALSRFKWRLGPRTMMTVGVEHRHVWERELRRGKRRRKRLRGGGGAARCMIECQMEPSSHRQVGALAECGAADGILPSCRLLFRQ